MQGVETERIDESALTSVVFESDDIFWVEDAKWKVVAKRATSLST